MKKLLAMLMATTMLFSFVACGNKEEGEKAITTENISETLPQVTDFSFPEEEDVVAEEDEEENTEDETTAVVEVTDADGEVVTDKDGEVATETVTKKPSSTKPASKKPETKAEIVEYFNKAVNDVKSSSKSVKQNYSKISLNGSMTLPGAVSGILKVLDGADKFVGDQLAKQSVNNPITYTGADIKAKFPVENEAWASKLTAADVSSATCTEKNGIYTITIKTVADGKSDSVKHGEGHAAKAFNVVLPGIVNDNIPGIATGIVGTASMNYPSSTVTIQVSAKAGKVLSADYDLKWTINFDKVGVIIPFTTFTSYTINW